MKKDYKSLTRNAILSGRNTYRDQFENTIYYNKRQNISYKIAPNKESTFATYQSRYVLCIISFILFYLLFKLNIYISVAASIIVFIFMEYKYKTFLDYCPQTKGLSKNNKIKSVDQMIQLTNEGIYLRIVLYMALAILLVFNTFISNNVKGNTSLIVISYIVSLVACFIAIKYILLIIRKKAF